MRKTFVTAACLAVSTVGASVADAAVLDVQMTGISLFMGFDGSWNIQTGPAAGQQDPFDTATFLVDGVSIGTLVGNMSIKVGLPGFSIPVAGGSASNRWTLGYFTVDFDTTRNDQGWLDLAVEDANVATAFYTGGEIGISLIGQNTGVKSQQLLNRLPAWQGFDQFETIRFSFASSNMRDVQDNGQFLTQFRADGTAALSQIPEPASAAVVAGAGLLLLRRRA